MTRIVKKPDVRRKEIVDAARKLFLEQDYESTTMNALMKGLDIGKGTIYHYFTSKEDLLEAVVADLIDEDMQNKQRVMESPEVQAMDAVGKFRVLVTAPTIAEDSAPILDELHRPGNTIMHTRQLGRYLSLLAPMYAEVIREGCEQGTFHVDCPLEAAEFLLAGVQFISDVGFYPWTEVDLLRRAKALPSIVEAQLRAPRGTFDFLAG
ncbi:MAG: TetR/AcrR family transcriptional regulator [Dehalococcoidia bacterium]|nr:TetR/AcrR family transcriptional regulator [Dehalococcoidia bacterium]